MWKKRVIKIDIIISIFLILFMYFNTTQTEILSGISGTELLAENNSYNFDVSVKPEYAKVKAGETVKLKFGVENIQMGESGLNNIVGNLSYDETLFEEVNIKSVDGSWNFEQNNDKKHERFGKFVTYTMSEGITEDEEIVEITLKLKNNLKPQKTEINFTNLKSSDGKVSVDEEDRKAIIEIYEDTVEEPEEPKPDNPKQEEPKKEQEVKVEKKKNNKPEVSVQTGDSFRCIVTILLVAMVAYTVEEIIRNNAKQSKGNGIKAGVVTLSLLILMGVLALGITSLAHSPEMEELINRLSKKEVFLNSEDYLVTDENVLRIAPNTDVKDILNKFNKEIEVTNNDVEETAVTGVLSTGMKVTDKEDGTKYTVGVVGELNGDGESDHVELTQIIRENVRKNAWIQDSTQRISADMSFDGEINKADIDVSIKYILYGELEIPKFESVDAPTIEVVEGTFNDLIDAYEDTIKVKISNVDKNAIKTMYKIEGVEEQAYKEIENNGTIELAEDGVYKVSAYSYGKEGNRSEVTYSILIKKNPNSAYRVITRVEREDGTYSETAFEQEERIGTQVKVGSERIGYTIDLEKSNLTGIVEEDNVIELIIYYSLNRYTITYNYNNGTVEVENPTQYTIVSNPITLNNPTRTGYDFVGWEGTGLSTATKTVTIPTGSTGDREYTATWKIKEYNITYNLQGGTLEEGVTNPKTYTIESNPITLNNPSRVGYNFAGWEGTGLTTATKTVTIPTGSTGDREYTAKWTPIEYTIKYNLEGGELAEGVTNPETYTIESSAITLNNP
ncbi:MAG: InlB B-repeat-containing protein, partial [Clostridia bacterium]|nr:InlB B-repeat-containing protein [Clostridia bacterium]